MNGAMFGTSKVLGNFVNMVSCNRAKHGCFRKFGILIFLTYQFSGAGITAGAHRLWAHRAYKVRRICFTQKPPDAIIASLVTLNSNHDREPSCPQ